MPRETLLDLFSDFVRSRDEFLVYDDGYRSRSYRYDHVGHAARQFGDRLRAAGIRKGDKVVFWGENRPEWVIGLWGCLLEGVIAVPIDYRASADLLLRIQQIAEAKAILIGDEVTLPPVPAGIVVWRLADLGVTPATDTPVPTSLDRVPVARDDVAEIVFTSGATADPKGVVITHRNILANVVPVEREILKYRKYGRPFFPLRFLNLLPLSHMFGQAMATFIPPILPGVVVFMRGFSPSEIIRQIKTRRVSVLVCVPKILDVLREHVQRVAPITRDPPSTPQHWLRRWWYYREVHRLFGYKFWCVVVGAAPLDPELEQFWSRLGFLVVQGYGLTETAPIVTINHPFKSRKGTVGTPIAGVEVKIAPDGEILVRGENVTTGYYKAAAETARSFEDGWFHTGDVGAFDDAGGLLVRGRKKEMIVTPEGLNVFPEDVEQILNQAAGVRESAVVGVTTGGEERVHAVLVLEPGTTADRVVREVNAKLEDHQKIRGVSEWTDGALPRTEGTRKLKRRELRNWVAGERAASAIAGGAADRSVESVVAQFAPNRTLTPATTLEELGLSSLERVELMMALEERFQTTIDEPAFAAVRSLADLEGLLQERPGATGPASSAPTTDPIDFPSWNRSMPARMLRHASLPTWILPLQRLFTSIKVEGLERLNAIPGPVVFAANHQSHMDAPVILISLPARWRYRIAPAMAKEFFKAHFYPAQYTRRQWFTNSLNYWLSSLFFNAFPLPQREAGTRQTLRYIGELITSGYSILIFPEGKRTDAGEINKFQPGIGMIGAKLEVPVVPVRIEGLDRVLHHSWSWPRRGSVRVTFGAPLHLTGDDYAEQARRVEEAVRAL